MAMNEAACPPLIQTVALRPHQRPTLVTEDSFSGTIPAAPTVLFRDAFPAPGVCWLWCILFLLVVRNSYTKFNFWLPMI